MLITKDSLPDYAGEMAAFHRAFAAELRAVVASLPLSPHMRVLDMGCGDGFYTALLAERLTAPGKVIGLDINTAYLDLACRRLATHQLNGEVELVAGELDGLEHLAESCDLVWCAQSLYSFPELERALRQMAATLRPGGMVAVLENDTLHQVFLPWSCRLEMPVRWAEFQALCHQSRRPSKFYVGRRLPAMLAAAGLEPLGFKTQCIDRQSPLDRNLEEFLRLYLERLSQRATPFLDADLADEFADTINPLSNHYLLRQHYFTVSWLNVLALGRWPLGQHR